MHRIHFQVRVAVYSCQQILTEISFGIFHIAVKKQKQKNKNKSMWFSVALVQLHCCEGLMDIFFNKSECRNCCLYIIIQKIAHRPKLKSTSKYGFSPDMGWEGNGGVLSMRMQVFLESPFGRAGSAFIGSRKKGEFRDWTNLMSESPYSCAVLKIGEYLTTLYRNGGG